MLVVTRKPGQRVFVGPDIEVMVGRILPNGAVRIGIKAPNHIKVVREELLAKGGKR